MDGSLMLPFAGRSVGIARACVRRNMIRTTKAQQRSCVLRRVAVRIVKPGDGTFLLGFPTQPPWRLSPGAFIVLDNRNRRCLSRRRELGAINWVPDLFQHCTMIIEVDAANLLA